MDQVTDSVIERAKDGDREAFEIIVTTYEKAIYNLALRMSGGEEDARDLTQEVFLKIYRSLATFHGESTLATWIYRVASNTCYDLLRKRKETAVSLDEESERGRLMDILVSTQGDPQAELERAERIEQLEQALGELSAPHRKIVILRDLLGLSYAEISDVLRLEEGTVKSRLARARRHLRNHLTQKGNDLGKFSSKKQDRR